MYHYSMSMDMRALHHNGSINVYLNVNHKNKVEYQFFSDKISSSSGGPDLIFDVFGRWSYTLVRALCKKKPINCFQSFNNKSYVSWWQITNTLRVSLQPILFSRFLCLCNDQTETWIPVLAGLLQLSVTTGSHKPLSAVIQILTSVIRHQRQNISHAIAKSSSISIFVHRASSHGLRLYLFQESFIVLPMSKC